jgi:hypothetical protein
MSTATFPSGVSKAATLQCYPVRGPEQYHLVDLRGALLHFHIGGGGDCAGINITGVRRDQCFGGLVQSGAGGRE